MYKKETKSEPLFFEGPNRMVFDILFSFWKTQFLLQISRTWWQCLEGWPEVVGWFAISEGRGLPATKNLEHGGNCYKTIFTATKLKNSYFNQNTHKTSMGFKSIYARIWDLITTAWPNRSKVSLVLAVSGNARLVNQDQGAMTLCESYAKIMSWQIITNFMRTWPELVSI